LRVASYPMFFAEFAPDKLAKMPPAKSIAKPAKKGGYKNYCKKMREEWKKKGEKVPVPEQGKRLGAGWKALSDSEKDALMD